MALDSKHLRSLDGKLTPLFLSGLGGLFALLYVAELFVFYPGFSVTSVDFLVGLFVSGIFMGALVYGGYWLSRSDLSPARYPRVSKWTLGGLLFFFGVNLPMIVLWSDGTLAGQISWGRWAATVGAAAGTLIGCIEGRAIQRELAAQEATIRADVAESQRQWLDYLNGILRHEVLNNANVITGYASLLLEEDDIDDDAKKKIETIHRQGQDMTQVICDVKVLIEATNGADQLEPRNLADVLADEIAQLHDVYDSVTVDASIQDDAFVLADDLLPRLFSNLLRNAVEHNDGDTPEVRVTVERDEETVVVHVADDGPGIPESERAELFERSDNTGSSHGLGLYLVRTLVERYGGTAELVETGDEGSRFAVELKRAEPPAEGASTADDSLSGEVAETPNRSVTG